jgi:hypothetical protein
MIKNSLDWPKVRVELESKISQLDYSPDIRKMLKNIDTMITELSKIEVEARRTKRDTVVKAQLDKINEAVDTVEKWVIMAVLYQ